MTEHELIAWAAGLFEGEGSVGIKKGRSEESPKALVLQLTSTDEDIVEAFHAASGCGSVSGPHGPYGVSKKPAWQWVASGPAAEKFLVRLLPYLGSRRRLRTWEVMGVVVASRQ